jgi:ketopantoate reductase
LVNEHLKPDRLFREKRENPQESTLQDVERGRRIEYDAIIGSVVLAGPRHGIKAPIAETVYALLNWDFS